MISLLFYYQIPCIEQKGEVAVVLHKIIDAFEAVCIIPYFRFYAMIYINVY